MKATLPLLPEVGMSRIVARRNKTSVTKREFLRDVLALAERLPPGRHVLNLCKDRYWFAATLFACIVGDRLSVLPSTITPEIVADFRQTFPDLVCLGDQAATDYELPYVAVQSCTGERASADRAMPQIPAEQTVMLVYTSGSTGDPKEKAKTFGQMYRCIGAEAKRLWEAAGGPCAVLGTVPFQHMYGLESTIFLPLLGDGLLSSQLPFFPADVACALAEIPEPRLLVTTPFHLRKLLEADISYPPIAVILSATAPLSIRLAAEAEAGLGASVLEIYGSTETGQVATRRPTRSEVWDAYEGIELSLENGAAMVRGGHLLAPEMLGDVIELDSPTRFRLLGRHSDMVNVAGKRSSLAYLNHVLAGIPGLRDGAFCIPETHPERDISRLAAFIVAPGLRSQDIQAALLQKLDPVFLPRPIVFLDALPRDGNGKISASAMADLIARHIP
ncbi:MAG: AMP-binding protein [Betaproteobacteria bacterium]|nr:AMP-binding protein [Betaproteobacteria bacterium]